MKRNVIIIGAAGRDFHNFNTFFRKNPNYNVVAFTAAQIPDIDGRKYPAELAGELYPEGIPIYAEDELPQLIKSLNALDCVFSYSDVPYAQGYECKLNRERCRSKFYDARTWRNND
jgi:predicted GTPase